MRINVIGTSGSGKSTFSKRLSEKLDIPYIEMDALYWGPDWRNHPEEIFSARVAQALQQEDWILDGNYNSRTQLKWDRAQIVVWIDYSFPRTLFQAIRRALTRIITKRELWAGTGNKESLRKLFSKDSIVLWTMTTYKKNRKKYLSIMRDPRYAHIRFIRIRSPREMESCLLSWGS
ncbi:adenylate kinase [Hahella sp. HN01]|uniref:adenylate kinase n=1 Tax=Hahella sp. HN01 TaxID=2847262 RepID=UPI001C1EE0D7|nr:adenylate kinase [Hahella sp. HN01]MBU6955208.1 adenylate kinase [Hahella sp. HN01]